LNKKKSIEEALHT